MAFELGAVTDDSDKWMEWCTMRINSALREEQAQTPVGSLLTGSPSKMDELLKFLTAHALMSSQVQGTAASVQNMAVAVPAAQKLNVHMMKGKKYNGNQVSIISIRQSKCSIVNISPVRNV